MNQESRIMSQELALKGKEQPEQKSHFLPGARRAKTAGLSYKAEANL